MRTVFTAARLPGYRHAQLSATCVGRRDTRLKVLGPSVRRSPAILSVVESCRRIKIPIRDYFAAVLPGLNNLSIPRLTHLTLAAWAARQNRTAA